jgi:hypothetical protein
VGRESHIRIRSAARHTNHYVFNASVLTLCRRDHDGDDHTPYAMARLNSAKKRRDNGHQPGPSCYATSP